MPIEVKYDRRVHAVYVKLADKPYAYGRDLDDDRHVDYAEDGTPIGIELLDVDHGVHLDGLPHAEAVGAVLASYDIRVLV
jgi:uncharacterized protein YuzE